MNVSDGILRARYRNTFERAELMTPGEVYALEFPLYATSNLFQRGHRIRVDVSSSDYPAYDANPNTGGPIMVPGQRPVVAENVVYHDAARPSHVVLPIIPSG
jgi:putative CocE/NonD family hydrolase